MNNTEPYGNKIVLAALNASYVHSNPALYALRRSAYAFLHRKDKPDRLSAAAEIGSCPVIELAEYTINDRYEDILFDLISRNADVIGLSVYIWNALLSQQLLADLRRLYPLCPENDNAKESNEESTEESVERRGSVPVILFAGGPEAGTHPEQYLANCDFVMTGQGEYSFSRFCERMADAAFRGQKTGPEQGTGQRKKTRPGQGAEQWQRSALWKDLPGVICKENGIVHAAAADPEINHRFERELPFLYDGTEDFEHRIIYYETSRGCPFRCTYCLSSEETGVVFRDMETVRKELQFFLDQKAALVKFVDRTFNANTTRAREIWSYLRDHDNGITSFHFEIGADLLTEEDISLLKSLRPGLVQLEIGIQSTNPDTLRAIRRIADNEKIFRAVRQLLEKQNMALHTDLIVGLPFEDYASFGKSFNEVYGLYAHQFQVGFLKVLSGTEMERKAPEYGIVCSARPPYTVLSTKWITPGEIDQIRRIADMVDIFWNSGLFRHAMPYLERMFDSPFAMFEALSVYYKEQKGTGALSPRLRGAFLEQFAARTKEMRGEEAFAFDSAYFRELLRFDERLHFHPSRRMTAADTFYRSDGKCVRVEFDYSEKHPVTKEAAYRCLHEDGGTDHE